MFIVFHGRLPTPVQVEAVPLILGGGDVMAVGHFQTDAVLLQSSCQVLGLY
jgi:hypothetical protein